MQNGSSLPSPTPSHASSCSSVSSCFSMSGPTASMAPTARVNEGEILEDLDWFYIKQLAQHCKELETKLDVELRVRDGIRRLLKACRGKTQLMEAAKSLKASNERVTALMAELQMRRQRNLASNSSGRAGPISTNDGDTNGDSASAPHSLPKASISLSDIRIPLIWKDSDHFKSKHHHQRRYALFCLAKIGADVLETELVSSVDQSCTDVSFDDVLIFNNVTPDFKCTLEVYCHALQEDCLSISSAPRKLKKSFHTSISKTIGKKLASNLKDELSEGNLGPKFCLVASGTMTLEDSNVEVQTIDLKLEKDCHGGVSSSSTLSVSSSLSHYGSLQRKGSTVSHMSTSVFYTTPPPSPHESSAPLGPAYDLPLFGHFCCRLAVVPEAAREKLALEGTMKAWTNDDPMHRTYAKEGDESITDSFEQLSDADAVEYRGEVFNLRLHLFPVKRSCGVVEVPLNANTELARTTIGPSKRKVIRAFYSSMGAGLQEIVLESTNGDLALLDKWLETLDVCKATATKWGRAAENPVELASIASNKFHFNKNCRLRAGSLYDETSLQDTPPKETQETAGDSTCHTNDCDAVCDLARKLSWPSGEDAESHDKDEAKDVGLGEGFRMASVSNPSGSPMLTWDSKEWKFSKSTTGTMRSLGSSASGSSSLSSDSFSRRFNTK